MSTVCMDRGHLLVCICLGARHRVDGNRRVLGRATDVCVRATPLRRIAKDPASS